MFINPMQPLYTTRNLPHLSFVYFKYLSDLSDCIIIPITRYI